MKVDNPALKVGDIIRDNDDMDIGVVLAAHIEKHTNRLFVKAHWNEAGICTDPWPLADDDGELFTIVSRA